MDKNTKRRVVRRLKIIEGQVRGLQKMVGDETYCIDVLTQTSAVKQALSGVENVVLEHHLGTHVIEQVKLGQKSKYIKEIMEAYKLSKRR